VIDLKGRTLQVFDRDDPDYGSGGIDFDGKTLVWDSYRRGIRISRYPVEVDSVIERFTMQPKRFRTGARGGALMRIGLAAPARVSIVVEQTRGPGSPCAPSGPPPPFCSTIRRLGTIELGQRRGVVHHRFTGILGRRKLSAGRFQATVLTRRGTGPAVRETTVNFTVVGR